MGGLNRNIALSAQLWLELGMGLAKTFLLQSNLSIIRAPKKKRIALTCEYFNLSTKCQGKCGDHNGDKTYFQVIIIFNTIIIINIIIINAIILINDLPPERGKPASAVATRD